MEKNKFDELEAKKQLLDLEDKIQALRGEQRQSKKIVRSLKDEIEEHEERLSVILSLKDTDKVPKIVPSKGKDVSESVAFMIGSDWHVEKRITKQAVNNLNYFNLSVAEQRINNFFTKGLKIINMWRRDTDINTLVLGLLGDLINGYLREEDLESNNLSPIEAVLWLQPRIEEGIRYLLKEGNFDKIIIPCCVGNHSRTTKKIHGITEHKNSFEFLMYKQLEALFKNEKKIEFHIPESYHNIVSIYGKRYSFHHGTEIKYGGGVGGLTVPLLRYIQKSNLGVELHILGHFHQLKIDKKFCVNGSLCGYDDYAIRKGLEFERPQQALFMIEKNKGLTFQAPIYV